MQSLKYLHAEYDVNRYTKRTDDEGFGHALNYYLARHHRLDRRHNTELNLYQINRMTSGLSLALG